jgi:signal peptidase II
MSDDAADIDDAAVADESLSAAVGGRSSLTLAIAVAAAVVLVDQLTKTWALRALADGPIDVVWTLRWNLAFNSGMAFSQGEGWGPVIGVVALIVVVVLLVRMGSDGSRLSRVATGLIVGGALGNVVDRLFRDEGWLRGAVVDFIDFQWFPIFNVADIAINVGAALLILSALRPAPSAVGS